MLLAIDVGNTQTVFGLFDGDRLTEQFRVGTDRDAHGRRAGGACCARFVDLESLDGIVLCSSVPQLVREYEAFAERWAGVDLLVLGPGVSTGVPIRYDDPREVGPDRIANAVAARERHGAPAVVVDFGTSTNFDVVSAAGEFAGGVLAPGDRDLDGRALRARRAAAEGAVRRAGARDQPDDRRRAPVGPRLRLRRPGRRDRRPHPRRARARPTRRWSRPAASPT